MRWFFAITLLLLISLAFDLGLLAYAMYVLLGVLLVSRALARTWVENISAVRECNRYSAQVGETVAVVVTLKNAGRLPVPWVLLEDVLPPHALIHEPPPLRVSGDRLQLAMLKHRGRKSMFYQLQCNRRGYYQIGPLLLETGDLFGLQRRYRVGSDPHFLLVYPEVVPLEGWDIASRRPIGEVHLSHRLYEDPTRIAGVRAYEAGDPLNRIHWRATARTGQLHSKVYEPSTVVGATLLLDFHRSAFDPHHEPFRSELAVTATASLANAVYQLGHQIGLVTNGRDAADRIRQEGWDYDIRSRRAARRIGAMLDESDRLRPIVVETRRGVEQLARILETLARVELTDGLNFVQLVEETASRLPRDATVVAVLASVPTETAVTLGNLRRRGFAVTAIVNIFDEYEFEQVSGRLLAEGIEVRRLKDKDAVATICRNYVIR